MSTVLKKKVNIFPMRGPITNVNPPIRVPVRGILLPITEIRKCVLAGAKVEEVLPDKSTVNLTLHNYDQDNGGAIVSVDQPDTIAPKKPVAKAPVKAKQLSKTEMDNIKAKFNSPNNPLKEELSRTADEADDINKKAAEAPVVEEPKKEEPVEEQITPQKHLTRKQLRKIREDQEAAAAKKEETVIDTTVSNDINKVEATPLADALKAINAGEEVIVKDVEKL